MSTARRISCTRTGAAWNVQNGQGYRFRMEITEATGLSSKVFVYLQKPLDPYNDGARAAFFSHVASPEDLETVPEDAPEPLSRPAYFRLAAVDLVLQNREIAEDLEIRIQKDLRLLLDTLDRVELLDGAAQLEISNGEALPDDGSASSSQSSDSSAAGSASGSGFMQAGPNTFAQSLPDPHGAAWENVNEPVPEVDGVSDADRGSMHVTLEPGQASQALLLQGFGMLADINQHAVIEGVRATLYLSATSTHVQLTVLRLMAGSRLLGRNRSELPVTVPTVLQATDFGDDHDLWGARSLPAEVFRGGEFGLMVIVQNNDISPATVTADGAMLTVTGYA